MLKKIINYKTGKEEWINEGKSNGNGYGVRDLHKERRIKIAVQERILNKIIKLNKTQAKNYLKGIKKHNKGR